ncbi:MAG: LysM peptidoglycan-binding domain-containing protein [Bacteroidota bacterium]
MKIIDLLRLIRKHIVLLVLAPVLLAMLVAYLTRKPVYSYSSETTLYTGIATGGGVEMDKSLSFFATNTAFDNLINVIKSRQTQMEVGIRLLAQHLMLDNYDPRYLSKASFLRLRQITPPDIFRLVVKHVDKNERPAEVHQIKATPAKEPETRTVQKSFHTVKPQETLYRIAKHYGLSLEELKAMNDMSGNEIETGQVLKITPYSEEEETAVAPVDSIANSDTTASNDTFSFTRLDSAGMQQWLPSSINIDAYEETVQNLLNYMAKSDTNFVYKLLNFSNPHYSVKAISTVNVLRIASSDLVRLKYDADDPGICQYTLAILTEVCIKNYKGIKENRTDAVVKYFEFQVKQASGRLKIAEDKLLKFNKDNNIINYYEQSKAVAVVKEDLDVQYNSKRMVLAGAEAAIKRIEQKLGNLQKIQLNSSRIIDLRNQLLGVNTQIANDEIFNAPDSTEKSTVADLKVKADKLKNDIQNSINDIYRFTYSTDGLPINTLLNDWMSNVILFEETRAGMEVLGNRIKEFQKQYAIYAPAGANLKRIEREINVAEQAYLELLHGLNLAKLKVQDVELSSNIKAVDPPFFPLSPNATKRSMLIVVAGLLGFLGVLITILAMEYLDNTLKNPLKAAKILHLSTGGLFPKIYLKSGSLNFLFITNRLLEMMVQQMSQYPEEHNAVHGSRTVLFFSPRSNEGKTVLMGNIALKLKKQGYKILVLTYSRESLRRAEVSQTGYSGVNASSSISGVVSIENRFIFIKRLFGYPDTRIDHDSPFLESPENYLDPEEFLVYQTDESFHIVNNYQELIRRNHFRLTFIPDFILIEIPPILYYSYPPALVESCDITLLVCRANRTWLQSDQGSLETLMKHTSCKPLFLLNGVEIPVIETVLGDLPKKRNFLQRIIKKLIRFQFFEHYKP